MNDSLRNYIKESNLFNSISFDEELDSNLLDLLLFLQLKIKNVDDSLDFWDNRTIGKWGENGNGAKNFDDIKWESFEIKEEEIKLFKNVMKSVNIKGFDKDFEESLIDVEDYKFPPYLSEEFNLSRNTLSKESFLLPHQQIQSKLTNDWKEILLEFHSEEKERVIEDDEVMLNMQIIPSIDIGLELSLEMPQETLLYFKEVMSSNRSTSKLDATTALLSPHEDDPDLSPAFSFQMPASPKIGSPPIFSRRNSSLPESSCIEPLTTSEEFKELLNISILNQHRTNDQPFTSPSGKRIGMKEWNQFEGIQPFPSTSEVDNSSSPSSPTARHIHTIEDNLIWSSPTTILRSSPPNDISLEIPIFPRQAEIQIKEEPIDIFDHFSQFSIKREDVDEIDQLENEDEIDQLEEDDIVPGIYQDLTSLFRNSTIPVVESSPTLECSTPNLLLESRIKVPSTPNDIPSSPILPESITDFNPNSKTPFSFPSIPISNKALSIQLGWQAWSMKTDETLFDFVDCQFEFVEEEMEMRELGNEVKEMYEKFKKGLEADESEEEWIEDRTTTITNEEAEEEETILIPRSSSPIIWIPPIDSAILNPPSPTLDADVYSLTSESVAATLPGLEEPASSFVDIISTQVVQVVSNTSVGSSKNVNSVDHVEESQLEAMVVKEDVEVITISSSVEPEFDQEAELVVEESNQEVITISSSASPIPFDSIIEQPLLIPTSLEYLKAAVSDNFESNWSSGNALTQFLASKGQSHLILPSASRVIPRTVSNSTIQRSTVLPYQPTQRPVLPFPTPTFLNTNLNDSSTLFRIITSPAILQMRNNYSALSSNSIELIDRPYRYNLVPFTLQEPHLILNGTTCVVFFQLFKLVGNSFKRDEMSNEYQSDLSRIRTKNEAIFTSLFRISNQFENTLCIFEEFLPSVVKSKEFAYTKPVLDALKLLSNSIHEFIDRNQENEFMIDVVIVRDSNESAQVVRKLLISLEEKDNQLNGDRNWITDDSSENEKILLQLPDLNSFSACYILAACNNSVDEFINMEDELREELFGKVCGSSKLAKVSESLKECKKQQFIDENQEEQSMKNQNSFQLMEEEYQIQELKGTQELISIDEEMSFSELFDYESYDYQFR